MLELFDRFGMITDVWFAENDLKEGYATVIDMKGCTLMHLPRINIIALKKFMFYIQVRALISTISKG